MAGRRGFRAYPRHLPKPKGKGNKECDASGFIRPASAIVDDFRQGGVSKEFADITPGFGTRHPRDVMALGSLADPSPIRDASPKDNQNLSKQDLAISDQEVELSIRENRPPRTGY